MHLAWEYSTKTSGKRSLSSPSSLSFLVRIQFDVRCLQWALLYRTTCSRVLPILWGRAGWIFLWVSADVSPLLYTAEPWKGWLLQVLANSKKLPFFRQTMTFITQVGSGCREKNITHVQPEMLCRNAEMQDRAVSSNSLSSGPLDLHMEAWRYDASTLCLWNFANGSEIFWECRIYEIIHLALLPEVGNFAAHPFVFLKYGSWKARGVGCNWKRLRPQLKKLQYQSQNAVSFFLFYFILLWLLLLAVLHFVLALMIYNSKNSV